MKQGDTVGHWIFLAEGDLKTAKDELLTEHPFTNTVCFHAQQCVEKYLKAYLSLVMYPFGRTHDIAELIELCTQHDKDFQTLYKLEAHKLTRYAVETRYPDEFYVPSVEEAVNSVRIAEKAREFIVDKINQRRSLKNR